MINSFTETMDLKISSVFIISLLCLFPSSADEHNHFYKTDDEVVVGYNTVGPYHNRQETYSFFSLPMCRGDKQEISHYHETIAEALQGVELEFSGLDVRFKKNLQKAKYCEIDLTAEAKEKLTYAIKNHYWYQIYVDDLPNRAALGAYERKNGAETVQIYTHVKLEFGYNNNKIVEFNITTMEKTDLKVGGKLSFSYEVVWRQSEVKFADRFERYLDPNFFQHRIHWFSIFNSFLMVLFLVGLVSMILVRTLRRDYARYRQDDDVDDMERQLGDEYGWKQVHADVFRSPSRPMLLSSLIGVGAHLFMVCILVVLLSIIGDLYEERASVLGAAIFVYAIVSPVAGYFGGSLYSQFGGKRWIKQMIGTAFLLPGCVCGVALLINVIAMYYHTTRAIPFFTMLAVIAICLFVILPLTLIGTILGRNLAGTVDNPCRINAVPRPIPEKKWYMEPFCIVMMGGILPFGSIFIEIYFIFTSFWAYKVYYVYGFMLLIIIMLMFVTACVVIVCTYFLLNSEDYRWRWSAFLSGASVGYYMYLYSIYYFLFKSKMYGLFQTVFYFGYTAVFSVSLGIMCGTIGYLAANCFVKKIYATIKID